MSTEGSDSEASSGSFKNPHYLNNEGMTPDTCISCGHVIGAKSQSNRSNGDWLKYYRALYQTSEGATLSDVSFASLDWRETQRNCGSLGPSERAALMEELGIWYQMFSSNPSTAHIFHESCWILLNRQLEENPDLDKLFEVCKDIPPSGRNDAYDSSVSDSEEHAYPLERPIIKARSRARLPRIEPETRQEIVFNGTDCFQSLPLEIRTLIASSLSTSDFLILRQISRSMAEVFGDRQFWRTRFLPDGERGFLNSLLTEVQGSKRQRDWRLIYRCSANLNLDDGHLFEFRRRWHNNRWLGDRYRMTKASVEDIRRHKNLLRENSWQRVSLRVRCHRQRPGSGVVDTKKCPKCWMKHVPITQAVPLNKSVLTLVVYVLREAYHTYITGLGLLERDSIGEPSLILGYRIPDQYALVNIQDKKLIGFNMIAGDSGIYAIQAIFRGSSSRWIGNQDGCKRYQWYNGLAHTEVNTHRDTPRLVRLITDKGVQALSGKFDYCKLVGLAIS